MRANRSPTPSGRIRRASSCKVPRRGQNEGLAWTTTRAPSTSGTPIALSAWIEMVTESDMSTSGSRSVRYAVLPRRLSSTTCPSTHSGDIRST